MVYKILEKIIIMLNFFVLECICNIFFIYDDIIICKYDIMIKRYNSLKEIYNYIMYI